MQSPEFLLVEMVGNDRLNMPNLTKMVFPVPLESTKEENYQREDDDDFPVYRSESRVRWYYVRLSSCCFACECVHDSLLLIIVMLYARAFAILV